MKKQKLNFDFPIIRDAEQTRSNQQNNLKLLKSKYGEFEYVPMDKHVLSESVTSNMNSYYFDLLENLKNGQSKVMKIKRFINSYMRFEIVFQLGCKNVPKHYATAVYLQNFNLINREMKREAKHLYKQFMEA